MLDWPTACHIQDDLQHPSKTSTYGQEDPKVHRYLEIERCQKRPTTGLLFDDLNKKQADIHFEHLDVDDDWAA